MKLAINHGKKGAPHGIAHGRATIPFSVVEAARDWHENGLRPRHIQSKIEEKFGHKVSINTLSAWLYYNTRIYG